MKTTFFSLFPLLALSAPACSQETAKGTDWPKFLGPQGTSVSTEKGIITPWPEKGLKVVWHVELGTGYAAPTIAAGKLYHFDRFEDQARLTCRDARTGAFAWKFEYPTNYKDRYNYNNGPRCCPVVDGDRVYLYGAEGMLHCLATKDGKEVWKINTRDEYNIVQNFFGVGSTPVVEGDLLLVMIGGSPQGSNIREFDTLKGNGTGLIAFDKFTGKEKYRLSNELASYASPVLATIDGRRWCFAFCRGGLIAFEPQSGKLDFHMPYRAEDYESVNAANPVVTGNQVLLSETYGPGGLLIKVKPGGHETLWSDAKKLAARKSMQCHWMTPILHDGYLYGSSGRHDYNAELRCIDWATGKIQWSQSDLTRSSLLMVENHFICLGEDGLIRLLKVNPKKFDEVSTMEPRDPKTGKKLLKAPCWAAPVLSHGLLYVRGEERLVCLELIPQK